ncbi:hypothetical protein L3X38_028118 [Prunus dulcis]|uniref:Uncharacterized protein n=1 Tax=Prunus dulcis TaxID=3755 RepID=A0AAD4VQ28_PRUDU|nr:hypothetical protein L3X38_028118 [Prunus dulcis]
MGSSNETRGAWSMMEDVSLNFVDRVIGSTRTDQALSSRWKILNIELEKWRDVLTKAMDNHRSGENLSSEVNYL